MSKKEAISQLRMMIYNKKLCEDEINAITTAVACMEAISDCRNELCLLCGNYKRSHIGACEGCRWKDV